MARVSFGFGAAPLLYTTSDQVRAVQIDVIILVAMGLLVMEGGVIKLAQYQEDSERCVRAANRLSRCGYINIEQISCTPPPSLTISATYPLPKSRAPSFFLNLFFTDFGDFSGSSLDAGSRKYW